MQDVPFHKNQDSIIAWYSKHLSTSLATVGWAILFLNHDECEATEKKDLICEENNICDPCRIILNRNSFMETPYNWEKAG